MCVSHDSLLSIVIPRNFVSLTCLIISSPILTSNSAVTIISITRFKVYKATFFHIYVKFVYIHIVINFSQNFICSFKCQQCCLTSDKYIGIISKENEFTLITCVTYVIYIN